MGITKKRLIINFIKKILFKTNIKNPNIKDDYDLDISKNYKYEIKKYEYIITTNKGIFLISKNKKKRILNLKLGFFGIAKYKNYIYVACYGNGHSKGCIYKFNIISNYLKYEKIVYTKKFQYFHEITIYKDNLYIVDSSWITPQENLIKFDINDNGDLTNKIIFDVKKSLPNKHRNSCHINSISFKNDLIYILFHNLTWYTNLRSKVFIFKIIKERIKFIKESTLFKIFFLSSAHDIDVHNRSILNSANSSFVKNNKILRFKNFFLKGYLQTSKKIIIGINKNYKNDKSNLNKNFLAIINKKNLKTINKIPVKYFINSILKL
tara:strand:+ start:442 stop:1407 length:966 start_codon:yes stop_codon:yes gene_type:complete